MYFLLNIGIFHCYVSLPEGNPLKVKPFIWHRIHGTIEYLSYIDPIKIKHSHSSGDVRRSVRASREFDEGHISLRVCFFLRGCCPRHPAISSEKTI